MSIGILYCSAKLLESLVNCQLKLELKKYIYRIYSSQNSQDIAELYTVLNTEPRKKSHELSVARSTELSKVFNLVGCGILLDILVPDCSTEGDEQLIKWHD